MKKITIKFEDLFCDFCTYEVEGVLEKFPEIEDYKISRKFNTLEVFLNDYKKNLIKNIEAAFSREGLKVLQAMEDKYEE